MDQAQTLRNLVQQPPSRSLQGYGAPSLPRARTVSSDNARLIVVTSGKGGVGKSNLSVNLSLCLCRLGKKTCLVDADLGLGNVEILLGLSSQYDLRDVVFGDVSLSDALIAGPEGLQIISAGSGWYELAQLSQWRLDRLIGDIGALGASFDFIIVDTGAGIGRGVVQFALAAQEIILVTTPEPTAITDAYSLLKVISASNGDAYVRLVVNMAANEGEARSVAARFDQVSQRFLGRGIESLGYIPRDPCVTAAVQAQTPFVLTHPRSAAGRSVELLAYKLLGTPAPAGERRGFARVVERMIKLLKRQ